VDLTDARVVSAEVLVRWRKGDGTLVPPVQFIPLAESSGLIVELTRALMRRSASRPGGDRQAPKLPNRLQSVGPPFRRRGDRGGRPRDLHRFRDIAEPGAARSHRTAGAEESDHRARRVIASLQGLGVHVGIDDLGTGHSGLSYMLKLGVDFIKIDKMFVDAIDTERYSTTIIETLVNLARDMRLEIIAEGVETFEQVQHLRARGIRKAQGYVFAPPLPGSSFLKLLAASDAGVLPAAKQVPDEKAAA
jgi:sensor c-di-GMP phosphodiesterase-like protein